ncbi:MAG: hypothetical protein Q9190_004866 [Brigantiaea leucoxantha]
MKKVSDRTTPGFAFVATWNRINEVGIGPQNHGAGLFDEASHNCQTMEIQRETHGTLSRKILRLCDIFNMDGSALIGHLPNTEHDALVIKGYWKVVLAQSGRTLPPGNITATIPVMVPPGAPHDNHIPYAVAAPAVVIVLTTVLTGTRLGLRIFRPELRWGGDDWAILVGALGTVAWFGLMLAVPLHAGATKHLWDITYYEYARFYSLVIIGQTFYYPVLAVIKISITLFNRRLTGLTSRNWMIFHNVFLALCVIFGVSSIFVNIFQCRPALPNFDLAILGGWDLDQQQCIHDSNNIVVAFSAIHSAMDFVLLAIPIYILFQMQMSPGKKIRLAFLFSVGFVSCLGSIMRQIVQKAKHPDITYAWPIFLKWAIVDLFFAVTVASLPTLNVLFNIPLRYLSKQYSSARGISSLPNHSDKPSNPPPPPTANHNDKGDPFDGKSLTAEAREEWELACSDRTLRGDDEDGDGGSSQGSQRSLKGKKKRFPEWEKYYPQIHIV